MSNTVTSITCSAADCLALVERSPAAVAAKDKAAWLALFASYNLVEDPVGSAPQITGIYDRRHGYRGSDRLGRFFDTFIAPNTIRFHVDRDVVCGLHVVRDLTIEITMSPQVVVRVPVHLLYELTVEDDALKIFRLAAHWEFWPMLKQQTASGWPFVTVGCASAVRLLRHMGIAGMAGYMRALSSVGAAGKEQIARFVRYFNSGRCGGTWQASSPATISRSPFPMQGRIYRLPTAPGRGARCGLPSCWRPATWYRRRWFTSERTRHLHGCGDIRAGQAQSAHCCAVLLLVPVCIIATPVFDTPDTHDRTYPCCAVAHWRSPRRHCLYCPVQSVFRARPWWPVSTAHRRYRPGAQYA